MAVGFDGALERARDLKTVLHRHGVGKVSIELSPGRPGTPHNRWYDTRFVGKLSHHIVSHRGMGPTPGLWLVKNGRTDVPGPLANGYGGFDEVYRIICMGWANHPGAGGPWSIPGGTIPRDNGRPYLWGTEYEGGIRLSDWTPSFREFMGRANAAICDWLGVDERSHGEHLTWAPGRKIDRLNYTTGSGRAELRPYLNGDDDMKADEREALMYIRETLANSTAGRVKHPHNDGSASVFYGVQETWEDTWALVHRVIAKPWEFSDEKQMRWRWFPWAAYGQSRRARNEAREANRKLDKVLEQQQAILAAQEGLDTPAVIARIDQHAAENEAALEAHADRLTELADGLEAAADEREELAQLVRQVQTGDLSAEDLVRLMGEKLAAVPDA